MSPHPVRTRARWRPRLVSLTIAWTLASCLGLLTGGSRAVAAPSADGPRAPATAPAVPVPAAAPAASAPAAAPAPGVTPAAPPAAAPAGPAAPEATKTFPKLSRPPLNHHLQFGLAILPGSGYRGIFPYQENVPCGVAGKRVCTSAVPFFLDVQPSFGITPRWDALVDLRFGIAEDFTQSRQFAVAPGFRYWVDAEYHTKFFATLQVALVPS